MNKKIIKNIKDKIIVLLWPEICPFCQKPCREGICAECRKKLESLKIREPRCMQCGKQIRSMEKEYCYDCMHTHHYYEQGLSLWNHKSPVNQSIYQFKYHNQRRYAYFYGQELVKEFYKEINYWNPDIIIPVPLHWTRRRKRGYNQAELLAEEIGRRMQIPVDGKSLIRVRRTNPQKKLGHRDRKKNLKHAFKVKSTFQPVKRVLLIDDIYTTGNTLDAASEALKQKGVENVYFLTISIGQGY